MNPNSPTQPVPVAEAGQRQEEPAEPLNENVLRDLETRIFYAETGVQALRDAARYWKTQAESGADQPKP